VSGPRPHSLKINHHTSLRPACQGSQATVPDADVDSAASFLGCLYIVSQYTVRLMTPCVWHILCLRNSSSVLYFRKPPNLPTSACRNRKCTECGTTAFGRNRMSAESAYLSTFGTETEIRSTSTHVMFILWLSQQGSTSSQANHNFPDFSLTNVKFLDYSRSSR